MKNTILGLLALLLAGCVTPPAEQLMPPLKYKQPINFHIPKQAYLYWKAGTQYSAVEPASIPTSSGLLENIVAAAITNEQRRSNPGAYTYAYGKAAQAVFMTSLKDILAAKNVFDRVELVAEPRSLKSNEASITVDFKSTRVSGDEHYKIILDVNVVIASPGKTSLNRNYLLESDPKEKIFTARSFKEQQQDVSKQLLYKVISAIGEWQQTAKPGTVKKR